MPSRSYLPRAALTERAEAAEVVGPLLGERKWRENASGVPSREGVALQTTVCFHERSGAEIRTKEKKGDSFVVRPRASRVGTGGAAVRSASGRKIAF